MRQEEIDRISRKLATLEMKVQGKEHSLSGTHPVCQSVSQLVNQSIFPSFFPSVTKGRSLIVNGEFTVLVY